MCNQNDNSGCIAEILTVISVLQKNATCTEGLESCDRGFLSCGTTMGCNTRPVMLYTAFGNGTPWSMPISRDPDETETSTIFRVEKIEDNCATFRVLAPNPDATETTIPYITTNSFFTMDLKCCCVIRCLADTFIDCI